MKNVSYEEALELMTAIAPVCESEAVPVEACAGRVLAEDVFAEEAIPPFDRSPYDGYAVKARDTEDASAKSPVRLTITEEIPAGSFPERRIRSGYAAKILTGAPLPEGADAVVKFEDTDFTADWVDIKSPISPGTNVIKAGEDVGLGEKLMEKGARITPPMAGAIAGTGAEAVSVYKRPCAGILCTGDELLSSGEALTPGKIRNTSYYMLAGYLNSFGIETVNLGIAGDRPEEIAGKLTDGLERCDCILTTGGASVGDYDVIKEAIALAGGTILFWKLRIKPGGSMVYARAGSKPVFALSGNPGAAAVALHLTVLPAIRKMAGLKEICPKRIQVKLLGDYNRPSPVRRMLKGRMIVKNGEAYFLPSVRQGSGIMTAMDGCQLIADIQAGTQSLLEGTLLFAYDLEHFSS